MWGDGKGSRYEGECVEGKQHGRWVEASSFGLREEGEYVEGKRHGRWVEAYPDGGRNEGGYVGGVKRGAWVETGPDGTRAEGEYVEGEMSAGPPIYLLGPIRTSYRYKKHGRWVRTRPDGTVWEQHWDKDTAVGDQVVRHPPHTHPPPPPTNQQRPIRKSGPRVQSVRPPPARAQAAIGQDRARAGLHSIGP